LHRVEPINVEDRHVDKFRLKALHAFIVPDMEGELMFAECRSAPRTVAPHLLLF
jgi:hypothetical protein